MATPQVRSYSFFLRRLCDWVSSASKTHMPVSASLSSRLWTNMRHTQNTWWPTREKWCYYLDTWSRQSLQSHFINHILEPFRKYILQTTITIVSFGKWILNFHLRPSEPFSPKAMCVFASSSKWLWWTEVVVRGQHPNEDKQRNQETRWKSYNKL